MKKSGSERMMFEDKSRYDFGTNNEKLTAIVNESGWRISATEWDHGCNVKYLLHLQSL